MDSALEAFWEKGYEATSMADLTAATGLHKASLYNAFGDKEAIYFRAVDRYHETIETRLAEMLAKHHGAEGIEAWLDALLDSCRGPLGRRGCFAANAIAERASCDGRVKKVVAKHQQRLRKIVQDAVEAGQADGALRADICAQELADVLWTFATGLRIAARGGESQRNLAARIATVRNLVFVS